ncbi:hypothetical protein ABZ299_12415 [Streptomyces sp. NPDC006184]|uniref:hypothetical protein n=1 Tax=Streptomyces sp. NPDC006184 TaxID=3155455 RepID=UPI0033B004F0
MAGITAEMVAAAEVEVTAAERTRAEAEAALMEAPTSTARATELTSALKRVGQARADAEELRQLHAGQVAAERAAASREELERVAAKDIAAAGKELKAARGKLEEAAEAAQRALVELMQQTEAYDALAERHAGVLSGQGLDLEGESGAGRSFLGVTVKARGQVFQSAGSGAVLACLVHRVAAARLPYPNYMVGVLQYNVGRLVPEDRGDGLLSGLPTPDGVTFPELPSLRAALDR